LRRFSANEDARKTRQFCRQARADNRWHVRFQGNGAADPSDGNRTEIGGLGDRSRLLHRIGPHGPQSGGRYSGARPASGVADPECLRRTDRAKITWAVLFAIGRNVPQPKGCAITRSVSRRITTFHQIVEAISSFTLDLSEKLRRHGLACDRVNVFFHTSHFDPVPGYAVAAKDSFSA
jgi:hypothetical protein